MDRPVPDWFYEQISAGLQALVVLHLPGAPGHETVALTEDVWVQTLWTAPIDWQQDSDAPRLHEAFLRLVRLADRWPAPRALLDALPARRAQAQLRAPAPSPAELKLARERLTALRRHLKKHLATKRRMP